MENKDIYDQEFELFAGKANEIFEVFLESMGGDPKFTRPVDDDDPEEAEDCLYMYTDRASTLIERFLDRISKLCLRKFGEKKAFDLDISSILYNEF